MSVPEVVGAPKDAPVSAHPDHTASRVTGRRVALQVYLAAVIIAAAAIVLAAGLAHPPTLGDLLRAGVLTAAAVGYREVTGRVQVLRRFLHLRRDQSWSDQGSIWTLAAVLTLPLGCAALVALAIYVHTFVRTWPHRAVTPARLSFTAATTVLGLAAAALAGAVLHPLAGAGTSGAGAVVLIQLLAYTTISLAVGTVSLRLRDQRRGPGRWRRLLPGPANLLVEAGSLALGAVLAQLLLHAVALAPLIWLLALLLQRACLVEELAAAARTDPKTGLLNAAAWRAAVEAQLTGPRASSLSGAVLLIDLDHFKHVNDQHGHLVGDQVLHAVADRLRGELREHDLLARFGGEEFLVWLPHTTPAAAQTSAERLRLAIGSDTTGALGADAADSTPRVTASIGVARYPYDGTAVHTLLAAADGALYAAKSAGRNRVQLWA